MPDQTEPRPRINRRQFLGVAGALGAGFAAEAVGVNKLARNSEHDEREAKLWPEKLGVEEPPPFTLKGVITNPILTVGLHDDLGHYREFPLGDLKPKGKNSAVREFSVAGVWVNNIETAGKSFPSYEVNTAPLDFGRTQYNLKKKDNGQTGENKSAVGIRRSVDESYDPAPIGELPRAEELLKNLGLVMKLYPDLTDPWKESPRQRTQELGLFGPNVAGNPAELQGGMPHYVTEVENADLRAALDLMKRGNFDADCVVEPAPNVSLTDIDPEGNLRVGYSKELPDGSRSQYDLKLPDGFLTGLISDKPDEGTRHTPVDPEKASEGDLHDAWKSNDWVLRGQMGSGDYDFEKTLGNAIEAMKEIYRGENLRLLTETGPDNTQYPNNLWVLVKK